MQKYIDILIPEGTLRRKVASFSYNLSKKIVKNVLDTIKEILIIPNEFKNLSPQAYRILVYLKTYLNADNSFKTIQKNSIFLNKKKFTNRPRLAYFSPLPPDRSGISNYSVELLPVLSLYYDIELIVPQLNISDLWIKTNYKVHSVEWFKKNANIFDRILYHFGNSPFHSHMFDLLEKYPGVVVLHDFFLSSVLERDEMTSHRPNVWTKALYHSHGYKAVQMRFSESDLHQVVNKYPANLEVLQNALGIIVHSKYSKYLARKWYGPHASDNWKIVPLLRNPLLKLNNTKLRSSLNFKKSDFIVSSFGFITSNKLNEKLLDAWLHSTLSKNENCKLVFVGENNKDDYVTELLKKIKKSGIEDRIIITDWVDNATFFEYLAIADVSVQLRALSRGETSAAVLDCMNYGLPTIINANGSMSELPKDAVFMLPDKFTEIELVHALETLWKNGEQRKQLSSRARENILIEHNPETCATQYFEAIDSIYQRATEKQKALLKYVTTLDNSQINNIPLDIIAESAAMLFLPEPLQKQLLVDVSGIVQEDLKSGIQRVVRAQLLELIKNPPNGFRIEPIYLVNHNGSWHYRYATSYACKILGIKEARLPNTLIDISSKDIFYAPDLFPNGVTQAAKSGIYLKWKDLGVSINFLIYDLLPILKPNFFPDRASDEHASWLKTIIEFSSKLICISNSVADELRLWLKNNPSVNNPGLMIETIHLGADIKASVPTQGIPKDMQAVISLFKLRPSFLMVGTVEPRKGYAQTLAAFEKLWEQGLEINLIIIGRKGWKIKSLADKLHHHSKLEKYLFWLEGISDEYLEKIYFASTCLIAASEGEGFGLPLIEAAQHKLPIIARDMPVFREVSGKYAFYFNGLKPEDLSKAVNNWLDLNIKKEAPQSINMPWLTWQQSTQKLLTILLASNK